jgi:hypothetical protein
VTALIALASMIKEPAGLLLVAYAIHDSMNRTRGGRFKRLFAHTLITGAIIVPIAAPFFSLEDPSFGLASLASYSGPFSPSSFIGLLFAIVGVGWARWILTVGFGAVFALILVRLGKLPLEPQFFVAASGWILLLLCLMGPELWPWYVAWFVPFAWLMPSTPRRVVVGLSIVLPIVLERPLSYAGELLVAPVLLVVVYALVKRLVDRPAAELADPECPVPTQPSLTLTGAT